MAACQVQSTGPISKPVNLLIAVGLGFQAIKFICGLSLGVVG